RVTLESPRDGARLDAVPAVLVVGFSEPMRLADARARLTDSTGAPITEGPLGSGDGLASRGELPVPTSAGAASYVLTVTAEGLDGHVVVATFAFVVGTGPLVREEGAVAPDDTLLVVGSAWLGGVATALGLVASAGMTLWLLGRPRGERPAVRPEFVALGPVCGIAGLLLRLSAARGARGVDSYGQVLSSQSGRMMLLGGVSWVLLWAALARWATVPSGELRGGDGLVVDDRSGPGREALHLNVVLGLSVPLLLSVAGSSHAATDAWALVTLFAAMAHVGAMATWCGGLAVVVLTYRTARDWLGATRWFATTATVSAALALLSGTLLAVRLTGLDRAVLLSGYGVVLGVKVALVAGLLLTALVTRSHVARAHDGTNLGGDHHAALCPSCRAAALAVRRELGAGVAVLLTGTLLGVLAA
ncbi:MAG: CopD family protein, partial [Phycicoccus sp.]